MVPLKPTHDLIFFRLRLDWLYPVLEDSDGVGFETIRYYLIINTIKDLYCDVLRGIATTCDYAVTNCHESTTVSFKPKSYQNQQAASRLNSRTAGI